MNIDDNFFDSKVNHIYPSELQLNKVNVSDTAASFLDLSISDGFVNTKIYYTRDDFDFDIVNIAVHLAVAGDVFDGVFLCCPFSHEMSWVRSGTY